MKVLIAGYYGFDNAGDELILSSLLRDLRRRSPGVSVCVMSGNPKRTSDLHHVNSILRWNPFKFLFALLRSDIFVFAGGDLFQDRTSGRTLPYYVGLVVWAYLLSVPVHFCAVSFDSIMRGTWSRLLVKLAVWISRSVSVRDRFSLEFLHSITLNNKPIPTGRQVRLLADPVFFIEQLPKEENKSEYILVILREDQVTPDLGQILREFSSQVATPLVFIPFSKSDLGISQKLLSEIPDSGSLVEWMTLEDLQNTVRRASLVLSQRLHGIILAATLDVPCVALPSLPKVKNMANLLGAELMEDQKVEDLVAIWKKRQAVKVRMASKMKDRRNQDPHLWAGIVP